MATKTTQAQQDPADVICTALMELVWLLVKAVAVVAWWALLFPMISIPVGVAVAVWVLVGWVWGVVVVGVSIAGIMLWRAKRPEMFERWITRRARARLLSWFRYRRRWAKLLQACNLTVDGDDATFVPRLVGVQVGDATDRLQVRMLAGQCPDDYENRTAHLAHAFGALECRATIIGPAMVELVFRHADSLAETIELPRIDGDRWSKDAA
jgi:hypothetical protein